jgi:hypothetical protein
MKYIVNFFLLFIPFFGYSQIVTNIPTNIDAVLKKSKANRGELEKVIIYCKNTGDPLKLKAAYFLIANMDIQYSFDYFWIDNAGKKIAFNELSYPNFNAASVAFEKVRKNNPTLHPQSVIYPDIEIIKGDFLINNIESAFQSWRKSPAKNISFDDFCEYILPYRVSVEPIQDWRSAYSKKFSWVSEKTKATSIKNILPYIAVDERSWFSDTWGKEDRKEPLPRLGALQLLFRKNGRCEDIADMEVFTLRSQGIPASLDIIPYWATASDSHFLNTVFDDKMTAIPYDVSRTPSINNPIAREPSKVIRMTYSKQPQVLANFEDQKNIPDGFMRAYNYVDITNQYWETTDIKCHLAPAGIEPMIAYACIFNGLSWKPTWWGRINNWNVTFTSMSKGAVYLPVYYQNSRTIPAAYPIAVGYHHEMLLKPDSIHKINLAIATQDKYLVLEAGKSYRLFYWNNSWKYLGQNVPNGINTLSFSNIPSNALYCCLRPQNIGNGLLWLQINK